MVHLLFLQAIMDSPLFKGLHFSRGNNESIDQFFRSTSPGQRNSMQAHLFHRAEKWLIH